MSYTGPIIIGQCLICGWSDTLLYDGFCLTCKETKAWSAVNRMACDGFHRGKWPTPDANIKMIDHLYEINP